MSKQILLLFLMGIASQSYIQAQGKAISFTDVEQVSQNVSAKVLFQRAKDWYEQKAADGDMELLVNSKGQLVGEMYFDYNAKDISGGKMVKGKIKCTVVVMIKDGRYKYTMQDFEHIPNGPIRKKYSFGILTQQSYCPEDVKVPLTKEEWRDDVWKDLKSKAKKNARQLANNLKQAMNHDATEEALSNDDW